MVFSIYVSIFIASFSVGTYNPLIPVYAKIFGATFIDLGVIGAAYSLPYVVFPVIVGFMSDKFDRRYFYLLGVTLTAITAILFVFASNVDHIIGIRLFGGLAYAFLWPPAEALLVDLSTVEDRIKVMGRYSFSWALGFLLGPLVGGLIVEKTSFLILFTISFAIGLAAIFAAIYGLTWRKSPIYLKTLKSKVSGPRLRLLDRQLLPVYVVVVIYSMVLGVILSIFPAYVSGLGITSFQIGILFSVLGVVRTITFLQSEKISKIGTRKAIVLGLAVQVLALFFIASFVGFGYFLAFLALLGFSMGIFGPLTLSIASKLASKGQVGATLGFVETFFGLGMTLGPFSGGLAAESFGASTPYLILAVLSILTVAPVLSIRVEKQR